MAFDLSSIIGSNVGDFVDKIIARFKADPTVALEKSADLQLMQLQLQGKLVDQISAQIEVDKAEAANANMFVAGWRPFIGWVCGIGLLTQFLINPFATFVAALLKHPIVFPALDLGTLLTLLFGMLGLGGMRTYEKVQGAPGADKLQ